MALNSNPSLLDSGQIIKRLFDGSNDAIRIVLAEATGIAIELNADDGDSVESRGINSETKASITNTDSGVIVPAQSCAGMKSFNLYTKTTSTITGSQVCTLEVSPSDTDDVWIATSVTVTPSDTDQTVVAGTASSAIVARRARVSIAASITSGTFDIYLNMSGV